MDVSSDYSPLQTQDDTQLLPSDSETFTRSSWKGTSWRPVYAKRGNEKPILVDFVCPTCNVLLAHAERCPKCGLHLLETPIIKTRLPDELRRLKWSRFGNYYTDGLEENGGSIRRGHDKASKHSPPDLCRTPKAARKKRL